MVADKIGLRYRRLFARVLSKGGKGIREFDPLDHQKDPTVIAGFALADIRTRPTGKALSKRRRNVEDLGDRPFQRRSKVQHQQQYLRLFEARSQEIQRDRQAEHIESP